MLLYHQLGWLLVVVVLAKIKAENGVTDVKAWCKLPSDSNYMRAKSDNRCKIYKLFLREEEKAIASMIAHCAKYKYDILPCFRCVLNELSLTNEWNTYKFLGDAANIEQTYISQITNYLDLCCLIYNALCDLRTIIIDELSKSSAHCTLTKTEVLQRISLELRKFFRNKRYLKNKTA